MLLGLGGPVSETIPHATYVLRCTVHAVVLPNCGAPTGRRQSPVLGGGGSVHSLTQQTDPELMITGAAGNLQETGIRTVFPELN